MPDSLMLFPGMLLFLDSGVPSKTPAAESTLNMKSKKVPLRLLKETSSLFKSNGISHVRFVGYTSVGMSYCIDGNNMTYRNGNNSSVHYSDCSVFKKTFMCVLKPN